MDGTPRFCIYLVLRAGGKVGGQSLSHRAIELLLFVPVGGRGMPWFAFFSFFLAGHSVQKIFPLRFFLFIFCKRGGCEWV